MLDEERKRRRTAHHEAAHVVVARELGLPCPGGMRLGPTPDPPKSLGSADIDYTSADLADYLTVQVAGVVATGMLDLHKPIETFNEGGPDGVGESASRQAATRRRRRRTSSASTLRR